MARLYSNENFPLPVVESLRWFGHDVITSAEAGNANQGIPDEEVLQFATVERRAVITLNRQDFISLHRRNSGHAGIIVCTFNPDFAALAEKIHATLEPAGSLDGNELRDAPGDAASRRVNSSQAINLCQESPADPFPGNLGVEDTKNVPLTPWLIPANSAKLVSGRLPAVWAELRGER